MALEYLPLAIRNTRQLITQNGFSMKEASLRGAHTKQRLRVLEMQKQLTSTQDSKLTAHLTRTGSSGQIELKRKKKVFKNSNRANTCLDGEIGDVESLNDWEKNILKEVDPDYEVSDDENMPPRREVVTQEPEKGKKKK